MTAPKPTHIVCPLCGKSSALRSFPTTGTRPILELRAFRGKGRAKGFKVISAGSGLDDLRLMRTVHDRLIEILRHLYEEMLDR